MVKWTFRGFDTSKKIAMQAKKYWNKQGYIVMLRKASKKDVEKGYRYRLYTRRK